MIELLINKYLIVCTLYATVEMVAEFVEQKKKKSIKNAYRNNVTHLRIRFLTVKIRMYILLIFFF